MLGKIHHTSKFMIRSCFMYGMNNAVLYHLMHTSEFSIRPVDHIPDNGSLHCVSEQRKFIIPIGK